MESKLTIKELNSLLINNLGKACIQYSGIEDKPIDIKLGAPYFANLKIYIFNCTNPPGARQAGEYKIQLILPNMQRGKRGHFDKVPGVYTLLMGYANLSDNANDGIFIIWELRKHENFAYSANVQVQLNTLLHTYEEPLFSKKKRGNNEWIVVCKPEYLAQAIKLRLDIDLKILLGEL